MGVEDQFGKKEKIYGYKKIEDGEYIYEYIYIITNPVFRV